MKKMKMMWIGILIGVLVISLFVNIAPILPPIIAILLAMITKDVSMSLFVGIFTGAFIKNTNIFSAFSDTTANYIVGSLANADHSSIIIFSVALGGMISVIARCGGTQGVVDLVIKFAKTRKMVKLSTWLMGILIFFDDYANTLIVGNTMRPLTDKMKISREKLSYIVDSTAAPIASLALISTWIGMEIGLLNDVFTNQGIQMNGFSAFISSIPYRFYAIFTIAFVFFNIITGRDYGPMYQAEKRAIKEGKVLSDNANPLVSSELSEVEVKEGVVPRWYNAFIPIVAMIIFTLWGLFFTGYQSMIEGHLDKASTMIKVSSFSATVEYEEALKLKAQELFKNDTDISSFSGLRDILGNSNSFIVLVWASFFSSFVAILLAISQKLLNLHESIEAWIAGVRSMIRAVMILVLAWALGKVCSDINTASYIANIASSILHPGFVPFISFVLAGVIAFATGTSWGTMSILIPIAIPIAHQLTQAGDITASLYLSILYGTIGAILAGASWGDHCSPISDTTIMSSMTTSSDHIDHVRTQMPYALTTAVVALLAGYLPSGFGVSPIITVPFGIALLYIIIRKFGKKIEA